MAVNSNGEVQCIRIFMMASSNCQIVKASASEAKNSNLIPRRVKLLTLKLTFTASLLDTSIKGTLSGTSLQVCLLGR